MTRLSEKRDVQDAAAPTDDWPDSGVGVIYPLMVALHPSPKFGRRGRQRIGRDLRSAQLCTAKGIEAKPLEGSGHEAREKGDLHERAFNRES